MGVEWTQALLAGDIESAGTADTITVINELLFSFDLVSQATELWILDSGNSKRIASLAEAAAEHAQNIGVRYDHHQSIAIAEQLHGLSGVEHELYYADIKVIAGQDYRLFGAGEFGETEVLTPAMVYGQPLEPFETDLIYDPAFDASTNCTPPTTRFVGEPVYRDHDGSSNFTGLWRTGVFVDYGKAIPTEARMHSAPFQIPNTAFIEGLTDIFAGSLTQFGYAH